MSRKLLLTILLAAFSVAAAAQNHMGREGDLGRGRIALTPVILESSSIPPTAANVVLNKLTQIVTRNGFAGASYDPRFIITANMELIESYLTGSSPAMQAVTLSPTLYIGNASTGQLFATCTLAPVKGAGATEDKAYMQAVRAIRADSPEIHHLVQAGKAGIIDWYNDSIEVLVQEAESLAAEGKYDDAIALLFTVPYVCDKSYNTALAFSAGIFQRKIDAQGASLLVTATDVWNADQSWSGANEAASYLSQIHPLSAAVPGAVALSESISKKLKEQDNREWSFTVRQYDSSVNVEGQRLADMAEIGKAMTKRPVNYYDTSSFGWWQ